MNKSLITGIAVGIAVATAGAAIVNYTTGGKVAQPEQAATEPAAKPAEPAPAEAAKPAPAAPAFAQVVAVAAIKDTYTTPREKCTNEEIQVPREQCNSVPVTHQRPVSDENRVTGSIAGAAAGALLGRQVGGGNGQKAATLLGAVAGGMAGNQVQKNMQENDTYTTQETRCFTVYDTQTRQNCETVNERHERTVGYNVTYQLGDKQGQVRMNRNPGKQIPVKDGVLVLD